MIDKEKIIIDGVDVSECEFYCSGACEEITDEDGGYINKCTECFDCYFKQLARKTQECEELKESVDKIKNYVKNQMFDVDCKNWFDRFIYTFEDWKKSICEANDRYRKALKEIEEFIKNRKCKYCSKYKDAFCPEWYGEECDMKEILDIINKAKGE